MKLKWWLIIFIGLVVFVLGLLLTLILTLDISWWWFFGTLIFFLVSGLIIGLIYVLRKWGRSAPPKRAATPKEGEEAIRRDVMYDKDEKDMIIIKQKGVLTEGMQGTEKTNVYKVEGIGYWSTKPLFGLVDLDNIKKRITVLKDPTPEEKADALKKFALNPEVSETEEELVLSSETGQPLRKVTKKRMSKLQRIAAAEKEKVEEAEAL